MNDQDLKRPSREDWPDDTGWMEVAGRLTGGAVFLAMAGLFAFVGPTFPDGDPRNWPGFRLIAAGFAATVGIAMLLSNRYRSLRGRNRR